MLRALRDTKIRTATGADQVRHRAPAHLSASGLWSGSSALRLGVVVGLGWLAAGVLAMVIVGSLVPFSFDLSLVTGRGRPGLSQFGWPITPAEDLVANFVGYLPVGVLVYLLFISATRRAGSSAMAALALAVAMSTALEWLQTMMPSRIASWMDVCTNGLGAAAGIAGAAVVAATGTWVPGLTRALCPRACAAPVTALACGLLLYHLIPFDFVTSTAALQRSLAQSRLWPFIPGSVGTEAGGLAVIGWLGSGGQFAVLGCLCMMCQAARGLNPGSSIRWSVWCVGLVAMATETAQLFVASHAFDTLDWLAAMAGGLVGIALAGCLRHRGRRMSLTVLAGAVLRGRLRRGFIPARCCWVRSLVWRWPARGPLICRGGTLICIVLPVCHSRRGRPSRLESRWASCSLRRSATPSWRHWCVSSWSAPTACPGRS